MRARRSQEILLKRPQIFGAQAEFGHLKVEQAQKISHARDRRKRNDFEAVTRHHRGDKLVVNAEIFDQCRIGRQTLAHSRQGSHIGNLRAARFQLRRGKLAQGAQQLVFMLQSLFLQLSDTLWRRRRGAKLFELDAAVIPVQLFSHLADAPHQSALSRIRCGNGVSLAHQQFSQASGFGQFDIAKRFFKRIFLVAAVHAYAHQIFVHLQAVFHERDFEFFAAQAAAQSLQRLAGLLIGAVGG